MTDTLYDSGRDGFANGNIDWVNDDIRAILIDTADYTVDTATHDNLDDIAAAARVATQALANKSTSAGTCDADNVVYTAPSGDPVEAVVLYKHTGTESTSTLIAYIDTASGLPATPDGVNDVTIRWDDGADKIFTL